MLNIKKMLKNAQYAHRNVEGVHSRVQQALGGEHARSGVQAEVSKGGGGIFYLQMIFNKIFISSVMFKDLNNF